MPDVPELEQRLALGFCIDDKAEARKDDGTVDLLYAFCGDSTRDLSLSIALARKNLKNLGKIFVVGGNQRESPASSIFRSTIRMSRTARRT